MVKIKKLFFISIVILFLPACGLVNRPTIAKHYDEFSKGNVCRLQNYLLKSEWGRFSFITIAKDGNNVKTVLEIRGVNGAYDFRDNATINFELYTNKQISDKINVISKVVDIKDWYVTTYTYYAGIAIPIITLHSSSSLVIPFNKEHLKKIANADLVRFTIAGNNNSIKGRLNKTDIGWFKKFNAQCCLASN